MIELKPHEQKEFEKTREFIRNVASMYTETDSIHKVTFDSKIVNEQLRQFFNDEYQGNLKQCSYDFNAVNKNYVMYSMQKLIKWCFDNKVQPYAMRQSGLRGVREVTFGDCIETVYEN